MAGSRYTTNADGSVSLNVIGGTGGSGGGTSSGTQITQAQVQAAIEASSSALLKRLHQVGTPYSAAPAANTASTIVLPATVGKSWVIYQLEASYGSAPTDGLLIITEGATQKYRLQITAPGAAPTMASRLFATGAAVTANLSAGGDGILGSLNLSAELIDSTVVVAGTGTGAGTGTTASTPITQAQVQSAIEASAAVLFRRLNQVGTPYSAAPAINTAATIVLPATTGKSWVIYQIEASYSSTPVDGALTITESTTQRYRLQITTPGAAPTVASRVFAAGAPVTASLSAGGANISGSLNLSAELI